MVRKNKTKKPASDLKMKIYNESLSRGKILEKDIYWKKKEEKANLVIPIEKNQKHAVGWPKEKKHR